MSGLARYIIGDVRDTLATLPAGSVDLVLTSPPFLALRSYLPGDHAYKDREVGAEGSPAAFLQTLLDITGDLRRVLAPHGSLCVELGDTYAGSGGSGGDYRAGGQRDGQQGFKQRWSADHWPLRKSLTGIPTLYPWSLAYGANLLTGEPSPAGRWRVRNIVTWFRPNPPVGRSGDKYRPSTSYMTSACVGESRYFDSWDIRNPVTGAESLDYWEPMPEELDVWQSELVRLSNAGFKGAHFATWPPMLCVRPVLSLCPQRVCLECGKPSERIIEHTREISGVSDTAGRTRVSAADGRPDRGPMGNSYQIDRQMMGWTDCGHNAWRSGVVLDCFAGSGTTLLVATGHGRDAIGIDLDARNADIARDRLGMAITVEGVTL